MASAHPVSTVPIFVSAIMLTGVAWGYFRAVLTAQRDLDLIRQVGGIGHEEEAVKLAGEMGPLRWNDCRVLLMTGLFVAPVWLSPLLSGSAVHDLLLYVALGAFLNPLAAPSAYVIDSRCIAHPGRFLSRWALMKTDSLVKTIIATGLALLCSYIPGVRSVVSWFGQFMLPVVPGKPASEFFFQLVGSSSLLVILMFLLLLSQALQRGMGMVMWIIVGSVFSWVTYQWFVNEYFVPQGSLAIWLPIGFLVGLCIECLTDYIGAVADAGAAE